MRFPCGAGLADLDAECDETPDSRLDAEPASLALESVEAKADNGENDDAREYSQHNGTPQPPYCAAAERLYAAARPAPAQPRPAPRASTAAQLAGLSFPQTVRHDQRPPSLGE